MGKPIAVMTDGEKIEEGLIRGFKKIPGAGVDVLASFLTPENLLIMSGTFLLWAASHAVGIGEAFDIALLVVGAIALGPAIAQALEKLFDFAKVVKATTDADIDAAAQAFADAVAIVGINTVLALLLRKSAKGIRAANPGETWIKIVSDTNLSPRFSPVEADPYAGEWWSKPKVEGRMGAKLIDDPAGGFLKINGETSPYGDVWYNLRRTNKMDIDISMYHELFHQYLTPRFGPFRQLRATMANSAYENSVLCRSLEEMLAEAHGNLRAGNFKGVVEAYRFPVSNGYISAAQVQVLAGSLGTIVVGSNRYSVIWTGSPPSDWANAGDRLPYIKLGVENLYGWWWINMAGGLWAYHFSRGDIVRWFDVNNHRSARGSWVNTGSRVEVKWPSGTQEVWPLDLVPSNQKGTSTTAAKAILPFTAVKIWDAEISKIAGEWRMSCEKWTWTILFDANGGASWSDINNPAANGRGEWHPIRAGIYVIWNSGSRDEWIIENGATGTTTVEGRLRQFSAAKT